MKLINGKYYIESSDELWDVVDESGENFVQKIAAPKDQTVLWSGHQSPFETVDNYQDLIVDPEVGNLTKTVDNYYGPEVASYVAHEHEGQTLEDTLAANDIVMPDWNANNPDSIAAWKTASQAYATNAEGDIGIVLGDNVNSNGVLITDELGAVHNNPNVGNISLYDSYPSTAGGKEDQTFTNSSFFGEDPNSESTAIDRIKGYNDSEAQQLKAKADDNEIESVLPEDGSVSQRADDIENVLPNNSQGESPNETQDMSVGR